MQRKIIALAIATALTTPALALADTGNVTLYGKANLSLDLVDSGTAAVGTAGTRSNRISSNVSAIGLKGSEDLGNGLSTIWQVEQEVDMSGAAGAAKTNAFATRNTFAGLSSKSWGTVLLGRHDTPYKLATRKLEQFADNIADNRSLMGGVSKKSAVASFDGRQPDVLAYITPSFNGFSGLIAYVNLNQALGVSQALGTDLKAKAWSLAGMYDAAPFYASLAYEVHDIGAGTTPVVQNGGKEKSTKLGLGYTQDAFSVGLAYEKTSDNFGGNAAANAVAANAACLALVAGTDCYGHNAWYLGGKYNFTGNDAVKLAYTKTSTSSWGGAGKSNAAKQFSLGYDHSMSKRTTLYALYTKLRNSANGDFVLSNNASSVNGVVAANAALNSIAGAGASPSALSFGMRHSF